MSKRLDDLRRLLEEVAKINMADRQTAQMQMRSVASQFGCRLVTVIIARRLVEHFADDLSKERLAALASRGDETKPLAAGYTTFSPVRNCAHCGWQTVRRYQVHPDRSRLNSPTLPVDACSPDHAERGLLKIIARKRLQLDKQETANQ